MKSRCHLFTAIFILLIFLYGCGKDSESPVEPSVNSGNLAVVVSTSGTDLDSDGYTIALNKGQSTETSTANDSLYFSNLEEGLHNVELTGESSNCSVETDNPKNVQILANQTTSVRFEIICEELPPSEIRVISGNNQKGLVETTLTGSLVIKVLKENGQPVSDIAVSWKIVDGAGEINAQAESTDNEGISRAEWTLGTAEGLNKVSVEVENLNPVIFSAQSFKSALSINCQPSVLDLPQNASGTFICELTKNLEVNGQVTLETFPVTGNIKTKVQPEQIEVTAVDTATFLIGVSEEGATSLGNHTVEITATNQGQSATSNLHINVITPKTTVNVVYLVPTDRTNRSDYSNAMELATRHLQLWVHSEMGNGKTFNLANPVVEVIHTSHNAEWYSTNPLNMDEGLWFWYNVVNDGFSFTGGKLGDKDHIWIFFIEAVPACGQLGGAGTSSAAVLPANDPRGLVGEQMIPYCPNEGLDNRPPCGWVGGFGHELGHAFGLPHPPGCDYGSSSCDSPALMWAGFRDYPDTYLRLDEKNQLENTPFFSSLKVSAKKFNCNNFGGLGSANR